ncbi:hypothetical protein PCASD_17338 [Puccinia coronata f. sp. avenae]|uniref:Uncharacterized protein n=1 Tax=Puccinia coronata f. sp. avenae TaxID=200324 RepID=A0A2N5U6R9_9BASI|nr:hypothetical protein PCASD_17338 [Puccinia coronata f. sp. avenae]
MTRFFHSLVVFLSINFTALATIQLLAQNFKLAEGGVRNVKLIWASDTRAAVFHVYRKSDSSDYKLLATGQFRSYDDYEVPDGPQTYEIRSRFEASNAVTQDPPAAETLKDFESYDNTKPSEMKIRSTIKLKDTYYRYNITRDKNGMNEIREYKSTDGFTFSDYQVVLTRQSVCALGADGFCKLEAATFTQNPQTLEVVMWAHWEEKDGYGKGRTAVCFGRPGEGHWRFGGAFRPLGHDSRDLAFFADHDGLGYIISSTRMNQDINIYRLTPDWHHVQELVTTVLKGQAREAPAMIYENGTYYLFTSIAAGWYPSTGKYISASNITGPWSENRVAGNLGGFSAQSGDVVKLGSSWFMHGNKWRIPDIDPVGTPRRQIILPITLLNGTAIYTFYHQVLYRSTGAGAQVYGVQNGRIVSVGKQVASTGSRIGHDEYLATIGVNTRPSIYYQPTRVPFVYGIDLGEVYKITQIELTTLLVSGSESAAQFLVQGSVKATGPFTPILNQLNNTRVGFVSAAITSQSRYRFITLKVQKFTNMHSKSPGMAAIHEFTVFAEKSPGHTNSLAHTITVNHDTKTGEDLPLTKETLLAEME